MSTSPPEAKHPEDPNPPPGTHNPTPRRPIYQTETTGNYWADVREAFKVQSLPSCIARFFLTVSIHGMLLVEVVTI
jgi:hypothetical protein